MLRAAARWLRSSGYTHRLTIRIHHTTIERRGVSNSDTLRGVLRWILGGALLFILARVLLSVWRAPSYKAMFADPHWREIARAIPRIKAAAIEQLQLDNKNASSSPGQDSRCVRTTGGVTIFYTIESSESGFVHHCSASVTGGVTPHAIGRSFTLLVAHLLHLPIEKATFMIGSFRVHHAEVTLDAVEHAAVVARATPELTETSVVETRRSVGDLIPQVSWQQVNTHQELPSARARDKRSA